ncbi:unnamed protein product [marine sediment metagenome]|uniref:Uncharacterized protein n=1 Tax=marine sediment metagenome TaxID=412755 RepID=X0VLU7_9ZZZZ
MKHELKDQMKDAILAAHSKALKSVHDGRESIEQAMTDNVICGALIEKFERQHKHTVCHELRGIMSGESVHDYLSINRLARKRSAHVDKRQLCLMGIIDVKEHTTAIDTETVKPSKTVSTIMTRAGREFTKKLKDRPANAWSIEEKEQFKRSMLPFLEIYNEIK